MAINDAFQPAFLICGTLGLLAACSLLLVTRPGLRTAALAACAVAALLVPTQATVAAAVRPAEVTIADPCARRALPQTGGLDGLHLDGALDDLLSDILGSSRSVWQLLERVLAP